MRTTILLGAGASADAAIPMAYGMTGAVVDCVRRDRASQHDQLEALDLATRLIESHNAARGVPPDRVDVETLFSAVQMLGNLDDLELAPFVREWRGPIGKLADRPLLYPGQDDNIRGKSAFGLLEESMVAALRRVIFDRQGSVEYLQPLLEPAGHVPANIVTLNYDTTVEVMAAQCGAVVDHGVDLWDGGMRWSWSRDDADIRLLKMHGSVDWLLSSPSHPDEFPGDKARRMKVRRVLQMGDWDDPNVQYGKSDPALIFGRRGKLRSEGPYLAMLGEFARILDEETSHLLIVGYSLRDDHVNDPIREWFNSRSDPRVTFIDPGLGRDPLKVLENALEHRFAAELFTAMQDAPRCTFDRYEVDRERHQIIAEGAKDALQRLR